MVNNYLQISKPVLLNILNLQMKQELDFLADFIREEYVKAVDKYELTVQGLKNIKAIVKSML